MSVLSCPNVILPNTQVQHYKFVVASHGFSDPPGLLRFWQKQKEAGNA